MPSISLLVPPVLFCLVSTHSGRCINIGSLRRHINSISPTALSARLLCFVPATSHCSLNRFFFLLTFLEQTIFIGYLWLDPKMLLLQYLFLLLFYLTCFGPQTSNFVVHVLNKINIYILWIHWWDLIGIFCCCQIYICSNFCSLSVSGGVQTLKLRIMSQKVYHCAINLQSFLDIVFNHVMNIQILFYFVV